MTPRPGGGYDEQVAEQLRGYLAQRRITRRELAHRLGQTDFWIGRRINGQTPISVGELVQIADALGESIGRFLPHPEQRGQSGGRAADNLAAGTRSSTDRASDYGSGRGHFSPFRRARRERRRHMSVVPLRLAS